MILVAGLVLVAALNLYALSGGADYGGGFWDLLARGPRAKRPISGAASGSYWRSARGGASSGRSLKKPSAPSGRRTTCG
jgi:hypothetical protein